MNFMRPILSIVLLAGLFTACKNQEADNSSIINKPADDMQQVVGIGKIEPENEIIQLFAEVGGIVQKVNKNENDTVRAGEVIFEIKHAIEDANILQLKSAVAIQKAQIQVDENAIDEIQIKFANSSVELNRLKRLFAKGAETKQVVDNAQAEMRTFEANSKTLQATVEVSKMQWKESNAQLAIAKVRLNQKFIKAPVSGILLELKIQPGNYIDSKEVVVQLNPEGRTIAICEIDELFANKIEIGQTAVVRNFGALDTLSIGKVYFTGSFLKKKSLFTDQAGEKVDRRVREIKILLDHPTSVLLNARVECVVFVSKANQ